MPVFYTHRVRSRRARGGGSERKGYASEVFQKTDLELGAATELFEIGLKRDTDVELQDGLPGSHQVPRDAEPGESVILVRREAVQDSGVIQGGVEADRVGDVEGVLGAGDSAAIVADSRPREPPETTAEEGELEFAEPVETCTRLPGCLEAQLLEQRQENLLGDAELVAVVSLLFRIEIVQAGAWRVAGTGGEFGEDAGIDRRSQVPPLFPVAAVAALRGRRGRPRGPVELPGDSRQLDKRVGGDDERLPFGIPAVIVVFEIVGPLEPHEAPHGKAQGSRDGLGADVDVALRPLDSPYEQLVRDVDRERHDLDGGVQMLSEDVGIAERKQVHHASQQSRHLDLAPAEIEVEIAGA